MQNNVNNELVQPMESYASTRDSQMIEGNVLHNRSLESASSYHCLKRILNGLQMKQDD